MSYISGRALAALTAGLIALSCKINPIERALSSGDPPLVQISSSYEVEVTRKGALRDFRSSSEGFMCGVELSDLAVDSSIDRGSIRYFGFESRMESGSKKDVFLRYDDRTMEAVFRDKLIEEEGEKCVGMVRGVLALSSGLLQYLDGEHRSFLLNR